MGVAADDDPVRGGGDGAVQRRRRRPLRVLDPPRLGEPPPQQFGGRAGVRAVRDHDLDRAGVVLGPGGFERGRKRLFGVPRGDDDGDRRRLPGEDRRARRPGLPLLGGGRPVGAFPFAQARFEAERRPGGGPPDRRQVERTHEHRPLEERSEQSEEHDERQRSGEPRLLRPAQPEGEPDRRREDREREEGEPQRRREPGVEGPLEPQVVHLDQPVFVPLAEQDLPPAVADERTRRDPLDREVELPDPVAADEIQGVPGVSRPVQTGRVVLRHRGRERAEDPRCPPGRRLLGGVGGGEGRRNLEMAKAGLVQGRPGEDQPDPDDGERQSAGGAAQQEGQHRHPGQGEPGAAAGGELAGEDHRGAARRRGGEEGPAPPPAGESGGQRQGRQEESEADGPPGAGDPEAQGGGSPVERPAGKVPVRYLRENEPDGHRAQRADDERGPQEKGPEVEPAPRQVEKAPEEDHAGADVQDEPRDVHSVAGPDQPGNGQQGDGGERRGAEDPPREPQPPLQRGGEDHQADRRDPRRDLEPVEQFPFEPGEPVGRGRAQVGGEEPRGGPVAVGPAPGERPERRQRGRSGGTPAGRRAAASSAPASRASSSGVET